MGKQTFLAVKLIFSGTPDIYPQQCPPPGKIKNRCSLYNQAGNSLQLEWNSL